MFEGLLDSAVSLLGFEQPCVVALMSSVQLDEDENPQLAEQRLRNIVPS